MAERDQLKVAGQVDIAADDPFAELTRIMGLEPRQQKTAAATAQAPAASHASERIDDEFGIDLEKELMGEFHADDSSGYSEAVHADMPADAPHSAEPAGSEEFEFEFGEAFEAAMHGTEAEVPSDATGSWHHADAAVATPNGVPFGILPLEEKAGASRGGNSHTDGFELDAEELAQEFAQALEADAGEDELVEMEFAQADPDSELVETATESGGGAMRDDDLLEAEIPAVNLASHASVTTGFSARDERDEEGAGFEAGAADDFDPPAFQAAAAGDDADFLEEDAAFELDSEEMMQGFSQDLERGAAREETEEVGYRSAATDTGFYPAEPADHDVEQTWADEGWRPYDDGHDRADALPADRTVDLGEAGLESDPHDAPVREDAEYDQHSGQWTGSDTGASELHLAENDLGPDDEFVGDDWTAGDETDPAQEAAYVTGQEAGQAVEPAPYHAYGQAEFSLEDELNALLGNLKSRFPTSHAQEDVAASDRGFESAVTGSDREHWETGNDPEGSGTEFWADHVQQHQLAAAEEHGDLESGPHSDEAGDHFQAFDDAAFARDIAAGLDQAGHDASGNSWETAPSRPVSRAEEDPLDVIAALAAQYSGAKTFQSGHTATQAVSDPASGHEGRSDDIGIFGLDVAAPPEIDTVEVADRAVALPDDLDIPNLDFEDDVPRPAYDDLDGDFASLLNDMPVGEAPRPDASSQQPQDWQSDRRDGFHPAFSEAPAAAAAFHGDVHPDEIDRYELDVDNLPGGQPVSPGYGVDEDDFDHGPAAMVPSAGQQQLQAQRQRRGLLVAGVVGAVALVGGVGAFALSFGDGSGGDVPVIVRADDTPVKVKPENPGGTTVPNQEREVYETVAGVAPAARPQQERLVTTAEEPIDVAPVREAISPRGDEIAGQPKSEDRIEQMIQEAEQGEVDGIVAVAPRKVRTMIVRPDGTLVPREDPTPEEEVSASESQEALMAAAPNGDDVDAMGSPMTEATASVPAADEPAGDTAAAAAPQEAEGGSRMPETVPVVPSRPAQQPIEVVGEVKPDRVAAVAPSTQAPTAAGGTIWSMQIASQPSEAAARSTYQELASRYGSMLSGREVNIVKAEIPGKGTFWRVRVPAPSRNEAIKLCENYKAAGGNCFVSR